MSRDSYYVRRAPFMIDGQYTEHRFVVVDDSNRCVGVYFFASIARIVAWWLRRNPTCKAVSPDGERCKYRRGHDATGQPHSWTRFGFGGPGASRSLGFGVGCDSYRGKRIP